jgi:hypothetical protein
MTTERMELFDAIANNFDLVLVALEKDSAFAVRHPELVEKVQSMAVQVHEREHSDASWNLIQRVINLQCSVTIAKAGA